MTVSDKIAEVYNAACCGENIWKLRIGSGMTNVRCSAAVNKGGFDLQRRLIHGQPVSGDL
jgi:hypothetical protein